MTTIRVEMSVKEIASVSVDLWATRLYERLKEAGVPALPDGSLEHGYLQRFDDPADFGKVIYEWTDVPSQRSGQDE